MARPSRAARSSHRDDQPAEVRAATAGTVPVVVAETVVDSFVVLIGPADLERCAGSPDRLINEIRSVIAERGVSWPVLTR